MPVLALAWPTPRAADHVIEVLRLRLQMGLVRMARPKAYVALYRSIDAARWKRQYEEGGSPVDKTPYGSHLAEGHGFDVIFARNAPR
jgi:hypothetical protein